MANVHRPRPWSRRAPDMPPVADEETWLSRRELVRALGLGGLSAGLALSGCARANGRQGDGEEPEAEGESAEYGRSRWRPKWKAPGGDELYPAERSPAYTVERAINPEDDPAKHNNFYEFLPGRAGPVYKYVDDFEPRPWELTIGGEVERERKLDLDELARIAPLEERVYRFRCVETWSMVVPWTGLPLAKLVEWCKPTAKARFVRFVSFERPKQAPGQRKADYYPWPYYEGLSLAEATHPLALMVTGIYGHGLPVQHGAPVRVIVPWKYGYKSPKSITRIEFTAEQPKTFWSDLSPSEYPFLSNVDPGKPHPRWSQATEYDITTKDRFPTRLYNGYESAGRLYG